MLTGDRCSDGPSSAPLGDAPGSCARPKPTIAVVDDDPAILRALDRLIRSHGGIANVFSSPAEFIQSSYQALPDCLILDVQLPVMSGIELYESLLDRQLRIPVIFITAHEDSATEAAAVRAGAAAFFCKPFRNNELWEAVSEALSAGAALPPPRKGAA